MIHTIPKNTSKLIAKLPLKQESGRWAFTFMKGVGWMIVLHFSMHLIQFNWVHVSHKTYFIIWENVLTLNIVSQLTFTESKSATEKLEKRRSGVFVVDFWCFYCGIWTSKCYLEFDWSYCCCKQSLSYRFSWEDLGYLLLK